MAAVTLPGYHPAPPPPAAQRPRRRWWLIGIVVTWALVLTGLAVWSVRNDPPTVPEQRDIADALPVLQEATGFMLAAADAGDRAVTLGELRFDRDCALTPVREGVEASREVTVRVLAGQVPEALKEIASALPAAYAATARHNAAGTRYGLRADAGAFVAVETTADSDARSFTLRASTGCRPLADGVDFSPTPEPVAPGEFPAALTAAVRALKGVPAGATGTEVACPGGGRTARTVTTAELATPGDLGQALLGVVAGAVVVQADPHTRAYRTGDTSVVVLDSAGTGRVSATTGCR